MKNSTAKLALDLALIAAALSLMCIGNQWFFFSGLALLLVSGFFWTRRRSRMTWASWLGFVLMAAVGVAASLFLTSYGREPLSFSIASVAGLGVAITEIGYWRASRNAPAKA